MDKELIERLAREAGCHNGKLPLGVYQFFGDELRRFAALVAEECAQTVEKTPAEAFCTTVHQGQREANRATFAAAIRAKFHGASSTGLREEGAANRPPNMRTAA